MMEKKGAFLFAAVLALILLVTLAPLQRPNEAPGDDNDERLESCTVVMVGKDASTDGSTMTTHTADCGFCDWTFRVVPAADHAADEMRKTCNINQYKTWPPSEGLKWDLVKNDFTGLEIPEAPHTYAYIHGMFGYMNEHQLAIGESTIGNVRKLSNRTPAVKFNITMLTLLAMERCKTAREAIRLMGSLAEKHGYGYHDGGEMLAVADPQEVWLFEIMPVGPLWTPDSGKPGAVWAAQRIPDDHVSVCPNESRLGELDLSNPDFFMASEHVVSFAVENGLYDPTSGRAFSWKKAYSPTEGSAASSARRARLWRFHDIVVPSQKLGADLPNMDYPFSVKPDRKLSAEDVMAITRDKCQGTPLDPVKGIRGGPFANPNLYRGTRLISTPNVEYTTITQCRGWLPAPVGGLLWVAFGAQDTSCYMPLYAGISDIPASFSVGDHWEFSRDSARWAFDYVDFHAQVVYSHAIKDIQEAQVLWEKSIAARIPEIDKEAAVRFKRSPTEAAAYLTGFCLTHADEVVKAWWELGDRLLVKYNHLSYYDPEKRTRERNTPALPELWQKAVSVFDILAEPKDRP